MTETIDRHLTAAMKECVYQSSCQRQCWVLIHKVVADFVEISDIVPMQSVSLAGQPCSTAPSKAWVRGRRKSRKRQGWWWGMRREGMVKNGEEWAGRKICTGYSCYLLRACPGLGLLVVSRRPWPGAVCDD